MSGPGVRFAVRLVPRGGRDAIEAVVDGDLRARVAAPPVDGAANQALIDLIAAELAVPRSAVRIVAGANGRRKLVAVDRIEPAAVLARWPDLAV